MAFGRFMQRAHMFGSDEGDIEKSAAASPEGAVVIETFVNIRIVASLCMEDERVQCYTKALEADNKEGFCRHAISGTGRGLGSFFQMWGKAQKPVGYRSGTYILTIPFLQPLPGYALMFYFGGWLLLNRDYDMREFLISLFGLMLSLTGLAAAMAGLTDADAATAAAGRIFDLIERKSEIDPLSEEGKRPNY